MKFLRYPGRKRKLLSFLVNYLPQNDDRKDLKLETGNWLLDTGNRMLDTLHSTVTFLKYYLTDFQ